MNPIRRRSVRVAGWIGVAALFAALPRGLRASESSGRKGALTQLSRGFAEPDFLFGAPKLSVRLRGGWSFARASSDVFDFVTEQLTVEKSDFNAPTLGLDLAYRLNNRVVLVFGADYSRAAAPSEFRDFVDQDDQPITQETRLSQVPLTAAVKLHLTSPGREISRFAWVPNSVVPYVGGGAGWVWYRLEQFGDFIDFQDLAIFYDVFESSGWAPTFHAFGGVDVKLARTLYLVFDVRYSWAEADLKADFVGFEPIDLSGLRTTVGIDWVLGRR